MGLRSKKSATEWRAPSNDHQKPTAAPSRRLRGAEIGAALGEAPDDLARAEVEARPFGARELVAARLEAARGVGRHVLLDPHRLVELVHAPARRVDGGLRVLAVVDDAREDLHVALRLHGAAHQAEGRDRLAVLGDEGRDDGVERPLLRARPGWDGPWSSRSPLARFCSAMPVPGTTMPEPKPV